jgi:transposase InsO family protein
MAESPPAGQRRHGIVLRLLLGNVLDCHSRATRGQLRIAIVTWVERTYQRHRRQAALGRLTPVEFEAIMNTTGALAA